MRNSILQERGFITLIKRSAKLQKIELIESPASSASKPAVHFSAKLNANAKEFFGFLIQFF